MVTNDLGYAIAPSCLSNPECDRLIEVLASEPGSRSRAGARHLMTNPTISALALDPRLTSLAETWLSGPALPFRVTLFEKSSTANWLIPWHQDTALPLARRFDLPGWGPWSKKAGATYAHAPAWALSRVIALRLHLDASDADNGPLRVIPGSHLAGVLSEESVAELVSTSEAVECCAPRGGVIGMRPLIVHSSSKVQSAKPRRVLHIEYADSLKLADGIDLAVV